MSPSTVVAKNNTVATWIASKDLRVIEGLKFSAVLSTDVFTGVTSIPPKITLASATLSGAIL